MAIKTVCLALAAFSFVAPAAAQTPAQAPSLAPRGLRVRTLGDTLVGGAGGVAADRAGNVYVATFGDDVYRVTPDGRVELFATGLYGASGNAIDSKGRLIQSSFYGNFLSRIDRNGEVTTVADGLRGPVGVALDPDDNMVVCNCAGNSLSRVTVDGEVSVFAESELFNCPNGVTRHPSGDYYVANFSDSRVLRVTPTGEVTVFAVLPGSGLGHLALARGDLYVTAFQTHRIYRVSMDGEITHVAGTGAVGEVDGAGLEALFSWPNGIALSPRGGNKLYVNDFLNRTFPTAEAPPVPLSTVRQITLPSFSDELLVALSENGLEGLADSYRKWKSNPGTVSLFTEPEINSLGYRLMSAGRLDAATLVFELNVESYPKSFNTYDSLAEAYKNAGRREKSIEFYRKSLELNPGNANATRMLEELGVD